MQAAFCVRIENRPCRIGRGDTVKNFQKVERRRFSCALYHRWKAEKQLSEGVIDGGLLGDGQGIDAATALQREGGNLANARAPIAEPTH